YLAHVRINPAELDVLYEDLLIGVTRFFRDPEVFEKLQTAAFREMMEARAPDTPVRIWVAGCAGGEEAYSLAIALLEFLGDAAGDVPIQIFGTDLSETSIARARLGMYAESITDDVSPERLRRFFVAEKDGYRIAKAVRDLCVFSRQNVIRDPPFSHLDLVSCRNVLIYLEPQLQRRVFPVFHYALEPHGLLVLGSAESVGSQSEYFEPLAKRQGIYRRRPAATRTLDVDFTTPPTLAIVGPRRRGSPSRGLAVPPTAEEITGAADQRALARFTPPGVVINEYMEILQFRGDTSGFLALVPGMASLDLPKLARPELIMPLHAAIRKARTDGEPVRQDGITLVDGDVSRTVAVDVLPFRFSSTSAQYFVVAFTVLSTVAKAADTSGARLPKAERRGRVSVEAKQIDALRHELEATKRYVQDVVQQHEATT